MLNQTKVKESLNNIPHIVWKVQFLFISQTNETKQNERMSKKKWHEIGASKCVVFAENKNCRAQDGNHMYVSLICENKTEKISNESLIFITHFWVFGVRAVNICPRFLFFLHPNWLSFFVVRVSHERSIILREHLFALMFAFLLLYHLSDAITSRLLYVWYVYWAQNEHQNDTQKTYYCLIRVSIPRHIHTHAHMLYIFQQNKKRQINK